MLSNTGARCIEAALVRRRGVDFSLRLDGADTLMTNVVGLLAGGDDVRPGCLAACLRSRVVLARVLDRLRKVVLDDEEGGELEFRGRLSHLADDVLIARVDSLSIEYLPLDCTKLLGRCQVDRLAFLFTVHGGGVVVIVVVGRMGALDQDLLLVG